jgi:cytochrome P450
MKESMPSDTAGDGTPEQAHARHRPPDHERLRALVSKAFTPRLIERKRPRIQAIADSLLDAVEDKGEMDLIDDYAFPLPITVIAELLGVSSEDRNKFREWSDAAVSGNATKEYLEEVLVPHMTAFSDYLRRMFEEKRITLRTTSSAPWCGQRKLGRGSLRTSCSVWCFCSLSQGMRLPSTS